MNKEVVQGAIDEMAGSAKSQIGELTGDTATKAEGAVQQIKGKIESAVGQLKDAVHGVHDGLTASPEVKEEAPR